jgi:prephenate dehydrogenase
MKLALIGCGLLGGSLAAAWRAHAGVRHVRGFDRDPARLAEALRLGIIDAGAASLAEAVADADCVALAVPVRALAELFEPLARHARADAILTDVGSTKGELMRRARSALGAGFARYVPGHPIAGGALPGVVHASAGLFAGRWVITTPDERTDAQALERVERAWRACGASIARMGAAEHDRIFAAVSHLPHLLAFALVHQIAGQGDGARKLQFAGGGFRDFTRIAASDPVMWRDIALANREAIGAELAQYRAELDALQAALGAGDGAALDRLFERASQVRRAQAFGADAAADEVGHGPAEAMFDAPAEAPAPSTPAPAGAAGSGAATGSRRP